MKIQTLSFYALLGSAIIGGVAAPKAQAEGSQTWASFGVNRVVRSENGHTDVSGTANVSFSQPINSQGLLDTYVNPYNNKPTAYLGGTSRSSNAPLQYHVLNSTAWTNIPQGRAMESDGGLQLETPTRNTEALLGWSAFIVYDRRQVNPRVWSMGADGIMQSLPWRGGSYGENGLEMSGSVNSPMSYHIGHAVGAQGLRLDVGVMGGGFFFNEGYDPNIPTHLDRAVLTATKDHPIAPWIPYPINNTNQAIANVKRVSGMTRANLPQAFHSELDGSEVTVTWSGCSVDGNPWTAGLTNQNATGYDAPGANAAGDAHLDRRVNGQRTALSRYILAFPGLDDAQARAQVTAGTPVYAPQRYANETVSINLRMAAQPQGQALEWAAP